LLWLCGLGAVEVFVDALDLAQLGFGRAVPAVTGRPPYHPSTMLKIYRYGYLNRIRSSRRRGITVNNIQPGPTLTDMTAGHIDSITPAIPLKRVGDPDEIAGLVAYLASGESGYMTGSSLTIDGGMAL
jgi:hypothetical protein